MKKFLLGAAAAVALTFTMNVGAAEAFAKVNDYAKVNFEDVAENAWYAPEIKNAYELGFMNGTPVSSKYISRCQFWSSTT